MTRYPRSGKGRRWTVRELDAVPVGWKGDSLSDGDGLTGDVRVVGDGKVSIRFKSAFKWDGKVCWHQCGTWPTQSLEQIRRRRDAARTLVQEGINPNDQKKVDRLERRSKVEAALAENEKHRLERSTVADMVEAWLQDGVARSDGNAELRRSFDQNVLPAIGTVQLRELDEHQVRSLLRNMLKRGANQMTVHVYNDMVQMFGWASHRRPWRSLLVDGNPMDLIEIAKILPAGVPVRSVRERVLSADEIRELRDIFERMKANYDAAPAGQKYEATRPLQRASQIALWLCLSTACRIGELLMSKWEHVDFDQHLWLIPKENTKRTRGTQQSHAVYLSDFALKKFRELHELSGSTVWCFPARPPLGAAPTTHVDVKSVGKQVGDRQMRFMDRAQPLPRRRNDDTLVLAAGVNGGWTPHDLRRTASTMMQALRISPDVIDRCQNHVLAGSRVRRHYMHHDYADEKREAWEALGERLEAILNGSNVVPITRRA